MNIAVTGATGRMGRAVIEAAADRPDVRVALAVNRDPAADRVADVRVWPAAEFGPLLEEHRPDVLVDFTGPESSVEYVEAAAEAAVPAVVGTTGFDEDQLDRLRTASETVPVLLAANFGRGVQALLRAVESALETLPGYDVEVTETHHNQKRDAPSGTAMTILDRIDEVRGPAERVHGRVGDQPRGPGEGEIGVHARRAGQVRGEHEVLVAGNDEVLSFTHRAGSRRVFAAGALDAATWIAGHPPGWYDFSDVLEAGR